MRYIGLIIRLHLLQINATAGRNSTTVHVNVHIFVGFPWVWVIVLMKQRHTQWSDYSVLSISQMKVQRQTEEEIGQNWKRDCASGWVEKKLRNMTMYDTVLLQNALWRMLTIMGLQYVSVHESEQERESWSETESVSACKCEHYLGLGLRGF